MFNHRKVRTFNFKFAICILKWNQGQQPNYNMHRVFYSILENFSNYQQYDNIIFSKRYLINFQISGKCSSFRELQVNQVNCRLFIYHIQKICSYVTKNRYEKRLYFETLSMSIRAENILTDFQRHNMTAGKLRFNSNHIMFMSNFIF